MTSKDKISTAAALLTQAGDMLNGFDCGDADIDRGIQFACDGAMGAAVTLLKYHRLLAALEKEPTP